MISIEIRTHTVDNLAEISIGAPVIHQFIPVVIIKKNVADHVDNTCSMNRVTRRDIRNELFNELAIFIHNKITTVVELPNESGLSATYTSNIVKNGSHILERISLLTIYGSTKEPQDKSTKMETFQFSLVLTYLQNSSSSHIILTMNSTFNTIVKYIQY